MSKNKNRPRPASTRTDERLIKTEKILNCRQPSLTVVLENINDPHNFSAVLRSCDATGILDIHAVYYGKQFFPKLGEKSSASARKWISIEKYTNIQDCFSQLRQEGKKIYTTHINSNSVSLYELDLTQPCALVFGNEHDGVSEEAVKLADANFLIPQVGMIQSLNISVACAVSLYEAYRQRLLAGMYDKCQFDEETYKKLLKKWLSM